MASKNAICVGTLTETINTNSFPLGYHVLFVAISANNTSMAQNNISLGTYTVLLCYGRVYNRRSSISFPTPLCK